MCRGLRQPRRPPQQPQPQLPPGTQVAQAQMSSQAAKVVSVLTLASAESNYCRSRFASEGKKEHPRTTIRKKTPPLEEGFPTMLG
eukprot:1334123-Amphidinium_carterae.1